MRALPMPPRKVTEFVPLPAQPAQVKVPEVEKVTGSALASDVASVTIARSNALIRVALKTLAMFCSPFCLPRFCVRTCPQRGLTPSWLVTPGFRVDALHSHGQTWLWKTYCF